MLWAGPDPHVPKVSEVNGRGQAQSLLEQECHLQNIEQNGFVRCINKHAVSFRKITKRMLCRKGNYTSA